MTAVEGIVLACAKMAGGHGLEAVLPESEIVIAAWRVDPVKFGLRGHPEHPDSNRVKVELSPSRRSSVLGKGYLRRVAPCQYRITSKGLACARLLLDRLQKLIDGIAPPTKEEAA